MNFFKENSNRMGNEVLIKWKESVRYCCFLRNLKIAQVLPSFDSGDAKLPSNYRPLLLLNSNR